jgi:glycine cleavage system H protein
MTEEYKVDENLYYTKEHEWARVNDDGTVTIGLADYAQQQLHEIVYVELPEVNNEVPQLEVLGAVESVKAVSDVYCPVSGTVVEVNEELLDAPEMINNAPYGEGWIAKLKPSNLETELGKLMDAKKYKEHLATEAH